MQDYRLYIDEELISLIKEEDDRKAYVEIYNRYEGLLFIHAYKRLKNIDEVRDIVHDLFVTIWTKRKGLNLRGSLRSYLIVAIRNRIFDHISRLKSKTDYLASISHFATVADVSTDHYIRHKQLLEIIEKEIELLPPRMREVFLLSRMEQLSHKEIAEKLDISEGTVKIQVKNALKVLKIKFRNLFSIFF